MILCVIDVATGLCVNVVDADPADPVAEGLAFAPDSTGLLGQYWTGEKWVGVGGVPLVRNTSGGNVAIGDDGLALITTGFGNIAFGNGAGASFADALNTVAIGTSAARMITYTDGSVYVGLESGAEASQSGTTTAVGWRSALRCVGNLNTAIGALALEEKTTVGGCTAVGYAALELGAAGEFQTAVGCQALQSSTGNYNIAVGYGAGASITVGNTNISIGNSSGPINNSLNNTIVGHYAAQTATCARNVIIGDSAGAVFTSMSENVVIGNGACGGSSPVTNFGVYIGFEAAQSVNNNYSIAIGYRAGAGLTTGARNVILGGNSCGALGAGTQNVHIGDLVSNLSTGSSNVVVGYSAFSAATTGFNNTIVGRGAGTDITNATNCTVIGQGATNGATGASNRFTLGNSAITTLRCQVTTITALSDERDKADIEEIDPQFALDVINGARPVTFIWDMRDGAKIGFKEAGFIAQDLQELSDAHDLDYVGLYDTTNPDRYEATPHALFPFLVAAVKRLTARVEELEAKLAA